MANSLSQFFIPKRNYITEDKETMSKKISDDVEKFLQRGGKIEQIEPGVSGDKMQIRAMKLTKNQLACVQFKYPGKL